MNHELSLIINGQLMAIRVQKKKSIMKQLMFIALALLLAACEKPVLDNDDALNIENQRFTY